MVLVSTSMGGNILDRNKEVAVIGAGTFGCTVALKLADEGIKVTLIDRLPEIIQGVSRNNTNRVHKGFHYPRDLETGRGCRDNFERFVRAFPSTIVRNFQNVYCIASQNSKTSAAEYIDFCNQLHLPYSVIDMPSYETEIRNCDLALRCEEAVCDANLLSDAMSQRLEASTRITCMLRTEVGAIERSLNGYKVTFSNRSESLYCDAVVNCCYSEINRLTQQLGFHVPEYQFEYTAVPIIEADIPVQGITIMDGPFMTLLPFGNTGKFSMYHVDHSVIATETKQIMNPAWRDAATAPFCSLDQRLFFQKMRAACADFVPALGNAKLSGFLQGPRMVLAHREEDDARPSLLRNHGSGYMTVFSGKIDHCFAIADQVNATLQTYFTGKEIVPPPKAEPVAAN